MSVFLVTYIQYKRYDIHSSREPPIYDVSEYTYCIYNGGKRTDHPSQPAISVVFFCLKVAISKSQTLKTEEVFNHRTLVDQCIHIHVYIYMYIYLYIYINELARGSVLALISGAGVGI